MTSIAVKAMGAALAFACALPQAYAIDTFTPQPYSTADPADWVKPVPRGEAAPAKATWQDPHETPKPTAEWWENMVLTKSDIDGNGNGFVIPYIIDPKEYGLKLAVPFPLAVSDEIYENGFDTIVLVCNLGATLDFSGGYHVVRHDKLTVDLNWGKPGESMTCTLARGSPYVTCTYDGVAPEFNAPQMVERFSVDHVEATCNKGTYNGTRFEVSFIQSDETWVIYTETPITFVCNNDAARMALSATGPFKGTVRAAMANNCTLGRSAFHCNKRPPATPSAPIFMDVLDAHAHVFPVGAEVAFSTDETRGTGAVHYRWIKNHFAGMDPDTPLLSLQMVHHRTAGVRGAKLVKDTVFSTSIHGPSWLAAGDEWAVEYELPAIDWHAPRDVASEHLDAVVHQLEVDAEWMPPLNYQLGAGDPYNAGKMLSRMARVALIAEHVGRDDIAAKVVGKLKPLSELYFTDKAANYILYDHSWGGIVSCGCIYDDCGGKCAPYCNDRGHKGFCPSLSDPGMDFGNGFYNDHHFHYGYHLYAAAVVAHFDAGWAQEHREQILLFARDFANPSTDDSFFPIWRNKDWYMGFSWASGIALAAGQPFRNGRNQESTSESINAYYALQLLGDALGDHEMKALGQIATSSEIHSAATYWHLADDNQVYPRKIIAKRMLGILWQNLAQYQTWFGGQPFMVHGIQMIPITPISEMTHPRKYTAIQYPVFAASCNMGGQCLTDGWVTFQVLCHAIVDAASAWDEMAQLPDSIFSGESPAGNGNSRVNSMYWIATRPPADDGRSSVLLAAAQGAVSRAQSSGLGAVVAVVAAVVGLIAWKGRAVASDAVARRSHVAARDALLAGGEVSLEVSSYPYRGFEHREAVEGSAL